ncbi:MAG TPA: hypothetical protein VLI91_07110 [Roseiarcus sp.]|nr:hypothetical protein [Roseiarcus sp.]
MDGLIGSLVMAMVPAYFILQPLALLRLSGRWRIAASAPLILAIPAAAWCLFALAQESNLWPLVFIFFAPLGTLYLGTILVLRLVL